MGYEKHVLSHIHEVIRGHFKNLLYRTLAMIRSACISLCSRVVSGRRRLASFAKFDQVLVDSFTTKPFSGNPAAIVFQQRSVSWMQDVASENNIPVTAFLAKISPESTHDFNIRWFTPTKEIYLCGHATLAASHALYESHIVPSDVCIRFHSLYSGIFNVTTGADKAIRMDFPSTPISETVLTDEELSCVESSVGIDRDDILYAGRTSLDLILEIKRSAFARVSAIVNYAGIQSLGGRGLVITCVGKRQVKGKDDYLCVSCGGHNFMNDMNHDFLLRGFFPSIGLNEDSVTGSALCALAPYYHHKFPPPTTSMINNNSTNSNTEPVGPVLLNSYQASQRGGSAQVGVSGDRVTIVGQCKTIMHSTFAI